jgi:hypothetical protein
MECATFMIGFLALEEIGIRNLSIMAWKPFFAYPTFSQTPNSAWPGVAATKKASLLVS